MSGCDRARCRFDGGRSQLQRREKGRARANEGGLKRRTGIIRWQHSLSVDDADYAEVGDWLEQQQDREDTCTACSQA